MKALEHDVATALAVLRRRLNATESRIYRLQPELLSLVASNLPKKALVKVTHVSHRWRAILLSFSRLWTDLNFMYREKALVFLERSKSRPISVLLRFLLASDIDPANNFLVQHATRIEKLTIVGNGRHSRILLPSLPSLREFEFSWGSLRANDPTEWITLPTVTALAIRAGDGFPFDVPRLTKLRIHYKFYLTMDEFLRFLNRCPLLEELEVGYDRGIIAQNHHDPVELPLLRFYNQHTAGETDLRLLDKLSLPPSCSVVFNYWNSSVTAGGDDNGGPFCSPSLLDDLKRINLKTTDLGSFVDGVVEFIDANNHRVSLATHILIGQHSRDSISYLPYATCISHLYASTVELLCVESPSRWKVRYAKEVLACMDGIQTLVLSGPAMTSYINALDPDYEDDDDGDDDDNIDTNSWPPWLCPALDVLVVHAQSFCDVDGEDIMKYLLGIAQKRRAGGMPFKSISLFGQWEERVYGPMESNAELEQLRNECVEVEIVTGDDAMDWNIDDYFFGGLEVRRDRYLFPCQRPDDSYNPLDYYNAT